MARSVEFNECEIIEKAMNVFWEKGYHTIPSATSIACL